MAENDIFKVFRYDLHKRIKPFYNHEILISIFFLLLGHGIVALEVPSDASGSYILQTLVNCSGMSDSNAGDGTCSLQSSSQMKLVGPVRDIIIRPARHAYRPADIGNFFYYFILI